MFCGKKLRRPLNRGKGGPSTYVLRGKVKLTTLYLQKGISLYEQNCPPQAEKFFGGGLNSICFGGGLNSLTNFRISKKTKNPITSGTIKNLLYFLTKNLLTKKSIYAGAPNQGGIFSPNFCLLS